MVFNMRNPRWLWFVCSLFGGLTPNLAHARCTDPNLFEQIPELQIPRTSRIEALLRFGEAYNLCFGLEYVDAALLTDPTDVHIEAGTMGQAIKSILGNGRIFSIEVHEGIIEIRGPASGPHVKDIFDYVIPSFDAKRGSLQEVSNVLHMYLVTGLNPEITGFAGHFSPGDPQDQIGPLTEHNRSLRYLLNAVLAASKGGAWIARIAWRLRGDFKMPEKRRIWTFIEYGVPSTGYARILANIASDLENDTPTTPDAPVPVLHPGFLTGRVGYP